MSIVEVQSFDTVSALINGFTFLKDIFSPVFLQYNGENQIISLQYKLRTLKNFPNRSEYILDLIEQYIENPIQIPSEMYTIEIYEQNSFRNLAKDEKYYKKIGNFFILNLENLIKLDSDIINIYIHSTFKLDLTAIIIAHISKQPIQIGKFQNQYELISMLKNNNLPPNFQCLNIPISFHFILNDFIKYFIPKKMLLAHSKWYSEEIKSSRPTRKKTEFAKMIENKYKITPLQFGNIIDKILNEILSYIQINHKEVILIENEVGSLIPEIPKGYRRSESTGIVQIDLNFLTNFDVNNLGTKTKLIFNFQWMKKIIKKYFSE